MVDTGDLKSPASNGVQVRLLFRAKYNLVLTRFFFAREASQTLGLQQEGEVRSLSNEPGAKWMRLF